MRFIYNLFLWIGFLFFIPGLLYKLKKRPGYKKSYWERFGIFSRDRIKELEAYQNGIWIHAVSVGETMVALSFLREFHSLYPEQKVILSTTTTTGQALARDKKDSQTTVIYCPIDFNYAVKRAFNLLKPKMLLILETELWPNMIFEAKKRNIRLGLINGRMSDHSCKGYYRLRLFFGKLLAQFDFISAQSEMDAERFAKLSYVDNVKNSGNMKFDQKVPSNLEKVNLNNYFGKNVELVILAASTHDREEALIVDAFLELKEKINNLKLILIPRHAERGSAIVEMLNSKAVKFIQKSKLHDNEICDNCEVLLADTTGEMLKFMNVADIVIMGKSLAGHDEGHNLIEPALLNKPIVCGKELKNFRYLFGILNVANALAVVEDDDDLVKILNLLAKDIGYRKLLGNNAYETVIKNAGANRKTIDLVMETLSKK